MTDSIKLKVQKVRPDGTPRWTTAKPAPPELVNIGTRSPKPKVNG